MIIAIPAASWRNAEGAFVARVAAPSGTRCVVWLEGWDDATAAAATAEGQGFTLLPRSAFAAVVPGGDAIRLRAPRPPESGLLITLPHAASPTLAAGWPRGLSPAHRAAPRATAPDAAEVARLLEAGDGATLLTRLGEALLDGGDRDQALAAARRMLLHHVHHPLASSAGLGLLAAALVATETP